MKYAFTLLAAITFSLFAEFSSAQYIVSGRVTDTTSLAPLANVTVSELFGTAGTVTSDDGSFRLELKNTGKQIRISTVGYERKVLLPEFHGESVIDLGTIMLKPAVIGLSEIRIIAPEAVNRKTPLAASTITSAQIERSLGDEPFPEVMKMVPGVYTTREGGGSGDARVNVRGFQQENVALLLNGVPISSVENGLVYWNNWLGLAGATQQVQVQRGLGASQLALNSVGGTINIITKTTDVEKGGEVSFSMTDYGNSRVNLQLSTGRLKNKMAVTFMGSRISGPGYVDATYVDGWAYFLSISKEFNKNHMLVFTALGNPERHGQRNFKLSQAEIDQQGLKYNKDWGSYNGRINNASENFYHKPHISLNHYWNISQKSFLATSAYFSYGKGGGKWTESFGNNPWIFSYYNPSGQLDWPAIYDRNFGNEDSYTLADGRDTSGYSVNIQTNFLASHVWAGLISTFKHDFNNTLKLTAGIHGRYFKSRLYETVRDLLGGGFFIDDYAYAIDGVAGRNQVKHVGDVVKIDNGATVDFISGFAQLQYHSGRLSAFAGATVSYTWYRREDRYNYVNDITSEWVSRPGADFKAGINFNLNEFNNLYLNGGYFSLAPYYKYVFGNYNNIPTRDLKNEKVLSSELGYGFDKSGTRIRLNLYLTRWNDKSILTNEYNQFEDPVMLQGLDALHKGVELELSRKFTPWMTLGGLASIGDWKWQNDVSALLINSDNVVVDTINVYADGLYVGDAPQFQAGLSGSFKILKLIDINAQWVYYDRFYADFNPAARTDPGDRAQSFRIPSYHLLDLFAGYGFKLGGLDTYVQLNCYNALNQEHIIRGEDGSGHDLDTFRGFWGFGRTFNFAVKIRF